MTNCRIFVNSQLFHYMLKKVDMKILSYSLLLLFLLGSKGAFSQTLNDAIRLTDNEQYETAIEAFKALIAKEPTNATYYAYLGDNYLMADNPDSALIIYKQGEKVD